MTAPWTSTGARPREELPPRLAWADTARGLALTLVVLFHATDYSIGFGFDAYGVREVNDAVRSLRMPLFFAVSGLFAGRWVAGGWRPLLRGKVMFLVWVFWFWEAVTTLVRLFVGWRRGTPAEVTSEILLAPLIPRTELWFLWTLAVFFIVARAVRRVPVAAQIAVAGGLAAVALAGWDAEVIAWRAVAEYLVFFLGGLHLRTALIRFADGLGWTTGLLAVALWAVAVGLVRGLALEEVPGAYLLCCVAGVPAGIALARGLASLAAQDVRAADTVRGFGARTLPVYVAHAALALLVVRAVDLTVPTPPDPVGNLLPVLAVPLVVWAGLQVHDLLQRAGARWMYEPPGLVGRVAGGRQGR
ncbi:acyltransferase family protein [Antribacter sp. KLBMP9083]|uniref:Acyltransferase family protein n=1 Tax=Antribacter soli TaxID=2910976 RepID=A0AA41U5G2_9MICO|nr:acyltransferase family protein [Antribacter soli]MCF4119998.1 acyltransferase family protein [Antribacter soli]